MDVNKKNLIVLCPNHHWDFDNKLLSINDIPKRMVEAEGVEPSFATPITNSGIEAQIGYATIEITQRQVMPQICHRLV